MDVKYCLKTQIVDECNLNCKGCDHFAPLAKPWHQPLNDFIEMMKQLIICVGKDKIKEIELYGGEPTLHENLYEIMMATKVLVLKETTIAIETNGILLDKFLSSHKDLQSTNRYEYKITEYLPTAGIVDKLRKKYPNLNIFNAEKTPNEIERNNACYKTEMFNVNLGLGSKTNIEENYNHCYCKSYEEHSVCLRNWEISPCPLVMCMDIFNDCFKKNIEKSSVSLKSGDFNLSCLDKIAHQPCNNCKYCGNIVYGIPYSISRKKQEEWMKGLNEAWMKTINKNLKRS